MIGVLPLVRVRFWLLLSVFATCPQTPKLPARVVAPLPCRARTGRGVRATAAHRERNSWLATPHTTCLPRHFLASSRVRWMHACTCDDSTVIPGPGIGLIPHSHRSISPPFSLALKPYDPSAQVNFAILFCIISPHLPEV